MRDSRIERPDELEIRPTGCGLGGSGWVTFTPRRGEMPSLDQLKSWLDESYRARASKKLAAQVRPPGG